MEILHFNTAIKSVNSKIKSHSFPTVEFTLGIHFIKGTDLHIKIFLDNIHTL